MSKTTEDYDIAGLLHATSVALSARVYEGLTEAGFADIRPAHESVLRNVTPDGLRIVDLAELAGITKQSMGYLVDDLYVLGYVELHHDARDGRAKLVRLTEKGHAAEQVRQKALEEIEADYSGLLGAGRMNELRGSLEAVVYALNSPGGGGPE
jgi:DNA-binding MarR family transcriptional regulator